MRGSNDCRSPCAWIAFRSINDIKKWKEAISQRDSATSSQRVAMASTVHDVLLALTVGTNCEDNDALEWRLNQWNGIPHFALQEMESNNHNSSSL